ncbi:hypothetical protein EIP91_004213 [Steccherinum ochraceum]|uniref:Uncharacterized protein n=1 Tax=Steccherinum ochraceum TaxID=92696 RepID=A0A4R0RPM5_9APHY|nr:hypothetical protein EIP91_004213 [Steccherinum ochraceum]
MRFFAAVLLAITASGVSSFAASVGMSDTGLARRQDTGVSGYPAYVADHSRRQTTTSPNGGGTGTSPNGGDQNTNPIGPDPGQGQGVGRRQIPTPSRRDDDYVANVSGHIRRQTQGSAPDGPSQTAGSGHD